MLYTLRPLLVRYGVALAAVALAFLFTTALLPLFEPTIFLLFVAAIMVSAWYGGMGPGLFAAATAALVIDYFLTPPRYALTTGRDDAARLLLFLAMGALIGWLNEVRARAERTERQQRQWLQVVLSSIADAVIATGSDGRVTFLNPAAAALTGWSSDEATGRELAEVFRIIDEQTRRPAASPLVTTLGEGRAVSRQVLLVTRDGQEVPVEDRSAPVWDDRGQIRGAVVVFRDVSEPRRREAERDRFLAGERAARARAEAMQQRLAFLARASTLLASSLDYHTTLATLAGIAVPHIADWCAVDILDEDGHLQRLAVAHVDPEKVQWAHELQRRYPPDPAAPRGVFNVLRTGQSEFYPEISDETLANAARDEEHLAILRSVGFTSAMVVPLAARGRTLGALTFVSAESGRRYDATDLTLAEDLARRAAIAVDNAWLYREAHEQREWLQTTLSSIGDAVIATDAEGRVIFMNAIAQTLTGWSSTEASGRDLGAIFRIVNEQTRQPAESPVARVLSEGTIVGLANHTLLVSRDGREIPIDDSGAPIRDQDGTLIGVVLVFRDITARRQAEREREQLLAQVQHQRERLDTIVGNVPGVVWEAWGAPDHTTQRIDFVSEYVETMLGYRVDEWLASPNFWLSIVHPDDRERAAREAAAIFASRGGGTSQFRWLTKDGRALWVEARSRVICDQDGSPVGMRGVTMDITDRKRAENRLRFLAEAGVALSSSLDYQSLLSTVAHLAVPQVADWCAIDMVAEDGTLQLLELAHTDPERARWAYELLQRFPIDPDLPAGAPHVVRTGRPELYSDISDDLLASVARSEEELELLRQAGYRSAMVVPMIARGRTLGAITFVSAESSRRFGADDLALAEELARRAALAVDNARLYQEAQEAIDVRDAFLSIASHELKTPLTALQGYAELLRRRADRDQSVSERNLRAVRTIHDQAVRLHRLIELLLDLSRLHTGRLALERRPLDLCSLVRRLADEIQPTLEQHTLDLDCPEGPLVVEADELRLEQVIQNLIQNAVKYSPQGGPVTVRVEHRDRRACVTVTDRGIGIPADALSQLFSRFYRAANVEERGITGMGLGLYVVKEIVTLHGGQVEVASKEGEGSTFTVQLPVANGQ